MKLILISPENDEPRELAVLDELFRAGLERYHVRKPQWSGARLAEWLEALPAQWRSRIVLHQHHELVGPWKLGGRHWPDASAPSRPPVSAGIASRACHDEPGLTRAWAVFDSILVSPMFPSLSKPGHAPRAAFSPEKIGALLRNRTPAQHRTEVFALGGVTAENIPICAACGFDGVAVLGAIWQAADPLAAWNRLQSAVFCHAA